MNPDKSGWETFLGKIYEVAFNAINEVNLDWEDDPDVKYHVIEGILMMSELMQNEARYQYYHAQDGDNETD